MRTKWGRTNGVGMDLLRLEVSYNFTDDADGVSGFCYLRRWFHRLRFDRIEARFLWRGELGIGLRARTSRGSRR